MNTSKSISATNALIAAVCFTLGSGSAIGQAVVAKLPQSCTTELSAFDSQLQKDGYWLHGAGYGFGYPVYGYGYIGGYSSDSVAATGYGSVRPGYEVRTLIASAHILAQRGDQTGCDGLLRSAREIYSLYAAELRSGKVPRMDVSAWRRQQIATAVSVTGSDSAFRSDQLVGTAIVNPQGDDLGSVDDIVMSPQSGRIAYLVISRGGIFGINKKYVPVPWDSFKAAPGNKLMVLATTKATLDAAPQVKHDQNFQGNAFLDESIKVNAFWTSHPAPL
ncbi:PRC-barrel domain-containing protein [Acidovorax sp. A1169]|uniref:PRC-barrel domain-containing protein n=1 Tax=Acidovorax sp. A1169 TaxID=3059524 RepID=UPI002737FA0E|nr:PRC-barrel domain-containing protein [Acidovorax sp. A1169]MDP4078959.1 PRC-barrel domain-containing protein [Acidovorax sp. A1169]